MAQNRFPFGALVAFVVVLLCLLGAFVLGTVHRSTGGDKAGIVVAGKGTVDAPPTEAQFMVTVNSTKSSVDAAMGDMSRQVRGVIKALVAAGVEKKDVSTTNLNVQPNYDYPHGHQVLTGYSASEDLTIVVRRLRRAGAVMAAAAHAAGNSATIQGLQLRIGDKSKLLEQARTAAVKDARQRAQQFAKAAGRSVGTLVFVQEVNASLPTPVRMEMGTLQDFAAAPKALTVPISAGQQKVTVNVSVRWSLD